MTDLKPGDKVRIVDPGMNPTYKAAALVGSIFTVKGVREGGVEGDLVDLVEWEACMSGIYAYRLTKVKGTSLFDRVVTYLDSPDRTATFYDLTQARVWLAENRFNRHHSDAHNAEVIERYLEVNPQEFCEAGIQRFRSAVDLPVRVVERTFEVKIRFPVIDEYVDDSVNAASVQEAVKDYAPGNSTVEVKDIRTEHVN